MAFHSQEDVSNQAATFGAAPPAAGGGGSSVCQVSGSISLISTYSPFKMRCTKLDGSCGKPGVAVTTGIAAGAVPVARCRGDRDLGAATDEPRELASDGVGTGIGAEDENTGMNEGAIVPIQGRGWHIVVCMAHRGQQCASSPGHSVDSKQVYQKCFWYAWKIEFFKFAWI